MSRISDRILRRAHVANHHGTSYSRIAKLNNVSCKDLIAQVDEWRKENGLGGKVSNDELGRAASKVAPLDSTYRDGNNSIFKGNSKEC